MSDSFQSHCLVDFLAAKCNTKMLNPLSQNTYGLSDIVSLMSDEMSMVIVPLLKAASGDYLTMNVDMTITNGQSAYTYPPRAVGNALKDIVLLDSAGNEINLNNLERGYIKCQFPFTFIPTIWSFGMYQTGNEANLYNSLIQAYTAYKLRFIVERRPGDLTLSTNCGQITNIASNVVTLSYVDPSWTTSTTFDLINNLPPFQSIGDDLTITNITGNNVTFSSVPSGALNGMWICPAMLSCIPQIPYELFPLLTELTVADLGEGLDMSALIATAKAKIQTFVTNSNMLTRPRIKGSPKVIINRDLLSGTGLGGMGGFGLGR